MPKAMALILLIIGCLTTSLWTFCVVGAIDSRHQVVVVLLGTSIPFCLGGLIVLSAALLCRKDDGT